MPSLKCLNDNYLPLSGGTLTGALTATKFTGNGSGLTSIPAGQLTGTVDAARLPDLSGKYLPISGGTITGKLTIGSTAINKDLDVKGNIACKVLSAEYIGASDGTIYAAHFYTENPNNGGEAVHINYDGTITTSGSIVLNNDGGTLTGISNSKGTSSTIAASQKCLSDNYVPFKNCPVLKQNLEIPVSEYSFILENNGDNLVANEKSISINDNMNLHTLRIDSNKITYTDTDSTKNWTFAGTVVSTTDLVAGTSALPSNQLYIVYE